MLNISEVSYSSNGKQILKGISTCFKPGCFSMIIGPNGSGKSSLLKIIGGDVMNYSGTVMYGDIISSKNNLKYLSKVRAMLSQHSSVVFPLTVEEVVMMGRYPHFNNKPSSKDIEIGRLALEKLHIENLRDRNYLTLSGGERQRVNFARTIAQIWEAKPELNRYLLLDEPINSLDPNFQHEFLKIAGEFADDGVIVVAVMHDVNLASRYGDFFLAMKEGSVFVQGNHREVLNTNALSALYAIGCEELIAQREEVPQFIFGY